MNIVWSLSGVVAYADGSVKGFEVLHDRQQDRKIGPVSSEDDTVHGYVDLHKIRQRIEYKPSDAAAVLGPNVMAKFAATKVKAPSGPI